ncbi:hypothetical protein R4B61_04725 [Fructilactobacillus vespulae]|uniref:hypothetical protein n=1 Tax=Fructilactobacillus vespulae TaxID=1249630 RepID=UPI0039B65559
MAIQVLVLLFSLLLLSNGIYFLKHTQKNFMMFKPESIPALSKTLKISGIIITVVGILGILAALLNNTILIVVTLIVGCVCCVVPEAILAQFINR